MNFGQQSSRASRREEIMRARKYEKLMRQIMDNLKQNYDLGNIKILMIKMQQK